MDNKTNKFVEAMTLFTTSTKSKDFDLERKVEKEKAGLNSIFRNNMMELFAKIFLNFASYGKGISNIDSLFSFSRFCSEFMHTMENLMNLFPVFYGIYGYMDEFNIVEMENDIVELDKLKRLTKETIEHYFGETDVNRIFEKFKLIEDKENGKAQLRKYVDMIQTTFDSFYMQRMYYIQNKINHIYHKPKFEK